jgi:hypothetical protein
VCTGERICRWRHGWSLSLLSHVRVSFGMGK